MLNKQEVVEKENRGLSLILVILLIGVFIGFTVPINTEYENTEGYLYKKQNIVRTNYGTRYVSDVYTDKQLYTFNDKYSYGQLYGRKVNELIGLKLKHKTTLLGGMQSYATEVKSIDRLK